jgi:mannose-1-phosphate guanylyltransferase
MSAAPWTIVLAAGAGRRLTSVTGGVPKQFWRPGGGGSLLDATLGRLGTLAAPERTTTVVDLSHRAYVHALKNRARLGEVVYQPTDRGTATGVLLPLAGVIESAGDPIVIITPSDHAVEDTTCFRAGLMLAIKRVQAGQSATVLFGVEPLTPSGDFGWITPQASGDLGTSSFSKVAAFVEKPPVDQAARLFVSGAVWNSMVVVARATALFDLYRQHLSYLADFFTAALTVRDEARNDFLHEWYPKLPAADFCRDVLAPARDLCMYTWPVEMGWSDLGTPDRLDDWLETRARASLEGPGGYRPLPMTTLPPVEREGVPSERGAA